MTYSAPQLPTLGEFVQMRRLALGVNQRRLASMLNVSYSYAQKIEQNTHEGSLSEGVISRMVAVFGLTADEEAYLQALAGKGSAYFRNSRAAADSVTTLLEAFGMHAAARYANWRILTANRAFRLLWPGCESAPTIIDWFVADPRARMVTPDWDEEVGILVAWLRGYAADPDPIRRHVTQVLLLRLWKYPHFRGAWLSGRVLTSRHGRPRRVLVGPIRHEVVIEEILLPWPQVGVGFESLFVGLLREGGWIVADILARRPRR